MKKHIPNTITCCNLISGCIATYFAFQDNYAAAFMFIIIGAVFDFFDGFAARLLHVASPIGKELDSLADDITFGMAPATIVFSMLRKLTDTANISDSSLLLTSPITDYLPFLAFLIAAFSGLRLAKFNVDERQTLSFIGLPTPANALFWGSMSLTLSDSGWLNNQWLIIPILIGILLSSWLLICEIPMFALKFKSYDFKSNTLRYSFLICCVILLTSLGWKSFPLIILSYIAVSVLNNIFGTNVADVE